CRSPSVELNRPIARHPGAPLPQSPLPPAQRNRPGQPWSRAALVILAAVILLGAALGWAGRARAATLGGDEATYLALSTSLESGQYRDTFLVGNPPHAKYPPALPAWLLVVRTVAGPDLDVVRAVNL